MYFILYYLLLWASLVAQSVKSPEIQETRVQPLDQEDPLEKEMATHFSILAWRIPIDRRTWQATVHGVTRVGHDLVTKPPPPLITIIYFVLYYLLPYIY